MAEQTNWSEAEEILSYRSGQKVEYKHRPGVFDTIIGYDPELVPPVILANDPQPRYPEELTLISQPGHAFDWFNPLARVRSASKTIKQPQSLVGSRR